MSGKVVFFEVGQGCDKNVCVSRPRAAVQVMLGHPWNRFGAAD